MIHHNPSGKSFTFFWLHISILFFLLSIPAYSAEPIDGFRDLKFGMSPQEVQALPNCSTSQECLYELSNKNRYITLAYDSVDLIQRSEAIDTLQLTKATIDMGQYTEEWYEQLQRILGNSYRLTHDFTDDTMNAFLAKEFEELEAGYEDGQILLTLSRRKFGNLTLNVVYQNSTLAAEFINRSTPHLNEP